MVKRTFSSLFLALICMCFYQKMWSNSGPSGEHLKVAMRMIGHELLLASGDSTSRVLPITKEEDRYKIRFASAFSFEPLLLSHVVDSIVKESRIASAYIVEVKDCDSGHVVYSYEVGQKNKGDMIPCQGRSQAEGCYIVLLRILAPFHPPDAGNSNTAAINGAPDEKKYQGAFNPAILSSVFIGFVISLLLVRNIKKRSLKNGTHLIGIGSYLFDHKNMTLVKGSIKQHLTGKESDLLQLLYVHLNSTVDRDVILNEVWRDEGAYIGRTLDVYISKLRKKLGSDPAINIVNVRGVGYKMTLD